MAKWDSLESNILFSFIKMHCLQWEKILVLDCFRNFIFFTEGSCELIMNDQALLIISIMTENDLEKSYLFLT